MNATWTGVFTYGTNRRNVVSRFPNQDWATIQFLIRSICDSWAKQGWYLDHYELTGVCDAISEADDQEVGCVEALDL